MIYFVGVDIICLKYFFPQIDELRNFLSLNTYQVNYHPPRHYIRFPELPLHTTSNPQYTLQDMMDTKIVLM